MSFKSFFEGKEEEKKIPKLEDKIFNPLKAYCGGFIEIKSLEKSQTFSVTEISEYVRMLASQPHYFTDYRLEDGDEVKVLRVNSKNSSNQINSIRDCVILLLNFFYEGEFNKDIQEAVKFKEFYKNNEDGSKITYYALSSGEEGFHSRLNVVKAKEEVLKIKDLKYWDFWRKPDPKLDGLEIGDIFLFVEIDQKDGYITMWEGPEIMSDCINVYNVSSDKTN